MGMYDTAVYPETIEVILEPKVENYFVILKIDNEIKLIAKKNDCGTDNS